MSEAITVIEREAQYSLMIPAVVGTFKMASVMGPAYTKLTDHFTEHGVTLAETDMPYTLYRSIDWDELNKKGFLVQLKMMFVKQWDLEIGFTCPEGVVAGEGMQQLMLKAGRFIRTIHRGPYRKVGETYTRMRTFAEEQNLGEFKPYSIEFYLNDPGEVAQEDLETEVLVPL